VVFLPIAFMSGIVGAYLREYGAVVVTATLFSLFVSFTLTPLLAAKWSVLSRSEAPPAWLRLLDHRSVDIGLLLLAAAMFAIGTFTGWFLLNAIGIFIAALLLLNAFVHRYEAILQLYRSKFLPFALRHGAFVVFVCVALLLNSITLVAGGGMATVGADVFLLALCALAHGAGMLLRRPRASRRVERLGPLRFLRSIGTTKSTTVATFALPVALALLMVPLGAVSFDFMPAQQTGEISMTVTYPPGTPIAVTNGYVSHLEDAILKIDGIKSVSATTGRKPAGWSSVTGGNYAQLNAQMQDNRIKDTNNAIKSVRKLGYLVPGAEFDVAGDNENGPAIYYSLTGPDESLGPAAEKVAQFLRTVPGAVNVQTSAENGAPRMNVDVDRAKCELLGINPSDVATVARIAVDGAVATKVRTPTGLVDVRVQFPAADRNTEDALKYVKVRTNDGSLVPIGDVASFSWTTAPTKIERLNRERVVNVYGDILPGYSLGQVVGPLQKKMQAPGFLPQGVGLKSQGNSQFMEETFANMGIALITSFMLVYILMVILYGSFLEPLIVMFSVPLAIIGALILLALMGRLQPDQGQSLNIISMLGVIMLFGLVAKNGILLVDYSNTLVKRGMRVHDAVLQASATRFRPIIMTTAAMIFGMLPLALGYAEGGEWRQAMGTVIIGGLLSSLILTLFLVPMIYETWIGYFERRADRRAIEAEMSQPSMERAPA
ncbi:MAG TPA: efflux RND transporter permease subunit, partial [Candidatus Cybelea sp.]|nr:efflux RND transporter permease subunit [Candidatus Cybelea sp.]